MINEKNSEELDEYVPNDIGDNIVLTVKKGEIIHTSDDSLIKVHHIGENGEVFYMAYADNARGKIQECPYAHYYGYISSCYTATEEQKQWLENWICNEKSEYKK